MRKQSQQIRDLVAVIVVVSLVGADCAAVAGEPTIATFAGTGVPGYSGDGGVAAGAQLNNPYGISIGPDGALYICDMENHRIRRVARDGTITTVVGTGRRGYSGDSGPALQAELNEPYEVRFDKAGNMFFVEMRNHIVRRVDAKTKIISTVAGTGQEGFSGDGGPATKAHLKQPHSIQFDAKGDLYICDIGNNRVRKVDTKSGTVSTFAGTGEKLPTPDGDALRCKLARPHGIFVDADGTIFIGDSENHRVRVIRSGG